MRERENKEREKDNVAKTYDSKIEKKDKHWEKEKEE